MHHANLLIGSHEASKAYLESLCQDRGIKLANNPDYFAFELATFGIEEARRVRTLALQKSFGREKIFFISAPSLSVEAQNALLKTFEDPTPETYFFLVSRSPAHILPTLLSRMQVTRIAGELEDDLADGEKFLSLSLKDRLVFAKKFVDDEKNLTLFLDELLTLTRKSGAKELMEKIYNVRKLILESASAPRLVLEHLAVML